jgi:hypothetical protein
MAKAKLTHNTEGGADQFVGKAGLACVAEMRKPYEVNGVPHRFVVWFSIDEGIGKVTTAACADAYAIAEAFATHGMFSGHRVAMQVRAGVDRPAAIDQAAR